VVRCVVGEALHAVKKRPSLGCENFLGALRSSHALGAFVCGENGVVDTEEPTLHEHRDLERLRDLSDVDIAHVPNGRTSW